MLNNKITENVSREVTEDITENVSKEVTENITENVSKEVTENITENVTENVSKEVTENITENVSKEVTENITENVSKEVTENITENVSKEVTENITESAIPDFLKSIIEIVVGLIGISIALFLTFGYNPLKIISSSVIDTSKYELKTNKEIDINLISTKNKKLTVPTNLINDSDLLLEVKNINISGCLGCHGSSFEKHALAKSKIVSNLTEDEIKERLVGYKNKTYGGSMQTIMSNQVKIYSESELAQIAKQIKNIK
jgi:hypothetical protein